MVKKDDYLWVRNPFRNPVVPKTGCLDPDLAEEMFNTRAMEEVVEVTSSIVARTPCPTHPIAVRALIATPVRPQVVMIRHSLLAMMGISFVFGQLNAIVEALFSQTTGHRFISLHCVCSLSLFLGLCSYYVIINSWMSTFTSSKVILMIFSQTPGGRCRTWTRCEEADWEVIRRLLQTLPMGSVRLAILYLYLYL